MDRELLFLQTRNQQLEEEEKIHIELHEESEQLIKDLHLALREQELSHLKELKKYQEKIDRLMRVNEALQAIVLLLK